MYMYMSYTNLIGSLVVYSVPGSATAVSELHKLMSVSTASLTGMLPRWKSLVIMICEDRQVSEVRRPLGEVKPLG